MSCHGCRFPFTRYWNDCFRREAGGGDWFLVNQALCKKDCAFSKFAIASFHADEIASLRLLTAVAVVRLHEKLNLLRRCRQCHKRIVDMFCKGCLSVVFGVVVGIVARAYTPTRARPILRAPGKLRAESVVLRKLMMRIISRRRYSFIMSADGLDPFCRLAISRMPHPICVDCTIAVVHSESRQPSRAVVPEAKYIGHSYWTFIMFCAG